MAFKFQLTLALVCTFTLQAFAQSAVSDNITLKGITLSRENNSRLAYTSVGIINKSIGTVADTAGNFSFTIREENFADTIQASMVGYWPFKISVRDFMAGSDKAIRLDIKTEELAEVIVNNLKQRLFTAIIGKNTVSKLVQVSIHNKKSVEETVGSEMGMLYNTKRKDAIIKDFNFFVSANNFNFIKFRINLYSVKEALPDRLLNNKQIFAELGNLNTGWTKIDLEQYHIKVDGDFIVTVQWIESRMDKKENPITILPVAVTPFSKNCYTRVASQDRWKRMGVNLSSFVTVAF